MAFSEKLQALRRERGLSQEKLGELVGVSRQAISKWESGQSCPDVNNLVTLSQLFGVSIDSMVKEEPRDPPPFEEGQGNGRLCTCTCPWRYEYRSSKTLWGLPLVHIRLGRGMQAPARGILAIGNIAVGVVALGGISVGVLSLGGLALGGLVLGGMAVGLAALGGVAVGMIAVGGLAVGWVALGGGAVGSQLACGGGSISSHVALGGQAIAPVAVSSQQDAGSQMVLYGVAQPLNLRLLAEAAQREISPLLRPVLKLVLQALGL